MDIYDDDDDTEIIAHLVSSDGQREPPTTFQQIYVISALAIMLGLSLVCLLPFVGCCIAGALSR